MQRCCPKTRPSGQTDDDKVDVITWKKESYSSLVVDNISFLSPNDGTSYEIGDIISTAAAVSSQNDIVIQKTITTTERYRLVKVINGVETNPPEYQNDGQIYSGKVSTTSYNLNDSAYEISLTEL